MKEEEIFATAIARENMYVSVLEATTDLLNFCFHGSGIRRANVD